MQLLLCAQPSTDGREDTRTSKNWPMSMAQAAGRHALCPCTNFHDCLAKQDAQVQTWMQLLLWGHYSRVGTYPNSPE